MMDLDLIKRRIDVLVENQDVADKRCWNLENDDVVGASVIRIFENSIKDAAVYYNQSELYFSIMGNRVKKDVFGSGGGWHQDTRIKPQKKWFIYLNDVNSERFGPTQFLSVSQTLLVKFIETIQLNLSNRVRSKISNYLCDLWGKHALYNKGIIFAADTRLIHRGTPIVEDDFERYALTLYIYGKHRPSNMQLTKIEL